MPYYGHVFPVQGPHGTRGPIGEFGAPRDGGRTHEGFDIAAACGTELVAVTNGRVLRTGYDPVLYGNYLLIHGEGEDRSYFYAHMPRPALVHRARPGRARGRRWVGNARSAATSTSVHGPETAQRARTATAATRPPLRPDPRPRPPDQTPSASLRSFISTAGTSEVKCQ